MYQPLGGSLWASLGQAAPATMSRRILVIVPQLRQPDHARRRIDEPHTGQDDIFGNDRGGLVTRALSAYRMSPVA